MMKKINYYLMKNLNVLIENEKRNNIKKIYQIAYMKLTSNAYFK